MTKSPTVSVPARTSVASTLDGCALIERWEGEVQFFWEGMQAPAPMQGLSVRAYDPETGRWYIHWMDTRTPRFEGPYTGRFEPSDRLFEMAVPASMLPSLTC